MHPSKHNSPHLFSACYYVKDSVYIFNFISSSQQPLILILQVMKSINYLRRQLGCEFEPWHSNARAAF